MKNFLISNENATGPGFGMFSSTHFIALGLLAVIIAFLIVLYVKSSPEKRTTIRHTLGIVVVLEEVIRDIILILTGQFAYVSLPFQLCGLGIFIVAIDAYWSTKLSRALLYSLTLPGAIMAIITPDWVTNRIMDLFVWQSFSIHAFLIAYCLMRLIAREMIPNFRELWRVVIWFLIVAPIVGTMSHFWGTNFFFLQTPVPGSPLAPVHAIFGNFYLLGFSLLVLAFWLVMYLPWEIVRLTQQKKNHF